MIRIRILCAFLPVAFSCSTHAIGQSASDVVVGVNKVKPALVMVQRSTPAELSKDSTASSSTAIGLIVDPKGIVITPYSSFQQGATIQVVFGDGSKLPAKMMLEDQKAGLAVLKVEADRPLAYVTLSDSAQLELADTVGVLGLARGSPSYVVSVGMVSATNRRLANGEPVLQIDSAISTGLGSGIVIDLQGNVVGLLPKVGDIGLAIPGNRLKEILLFAACPSQDLCDRKKVVEHAAKACELTNWKDARCLDILAAAHAGNGDLKEAAKWLKKAIEVGYSDNAEQMKAQNLLELIEALDRVAPGN